MEREMALLTGEPVVTLIDATDRPYETAVAAARTCYSSRGIIYPDEVSATQRARDVRDRIASSTLLAGHLTTRQHATFVFAVDRVSRAAVWSFLHSHPFYNSEQVSQRYVEVKPGNYVVPDMPPRALAIYQAAAHRQMEAYTQLTDLLTPVVADAFHSVFPARRKNPQRWHKTILRKAYEVARYVLPVATYTYLYHTVSALTLLRYARLAEHFDTPTEQRLLVRRMLDVVRERDPLFALDSQDSIPLVETPEYAYLSAQEDIRACAAEHARDFDARLGGRPSVLVDYSARAEATLADAVRTTLGAPASALADADALPLLLDPRRNRYLAETLNVHTLAKLSRAMAHVHYTFAKKLSHTADSQDQRHRMVPASRPVLRAHYTGLPDTVTPLLIQRSPAARELFDRVNASAFEDINRLLDMGVADEFAFYLLPNAYAIRIVESGSLLDLQHKWRTRLCYTAQEEIFHASVAEVLEVAAVHPTIGAYLHAPCWSRSLAGERPFCPEGDRFCGVAVWRLRPESFQRAI
jgi:flavin-dependent thymidylate synthase